MTWIICYATEFLTVRFNFEVLEGRMDDIEIVEVINLENDKDVINLNDTIDENNVVEIIETVTEVMSESDSSSSSDSDSSSSSDSDSSSSSDSSDSGIYANPNTIARVLLMRAMDLNTMSQEQLLQLSNSLGYVKRDRWKSKCDRVINRMPLSFYDESCRNDCCVICLNDFSPDEAVKELKCKHLYHPECIDKWLKEKDTCAICKASINN